MKRPAGAALAAISTLALALTGCGSSDLGSSAPSAGNASVTVAPVTANPELLAKLPAKVQQTKVIEVGMEASYKPNEYVDADGKTLIGMDVDLFNAIAAKMGVKANYNNTQFATILNGVLAKKYDVGMSSFTINQQRIKTVNMVSYMNAGSLWATAPGNPKKVGPKAPCGKTVAVQIGTTQEEELAGMQKGVCKADPIKVLPFEGQGEVNTAVMSGRADATTADSPITSYAVKQSNGKLEKLGEVYDGAPYGVVVQKQEAQFAEAVQQALTELKKDGQYDAILAKWGQADAAVTTFALNPQA